MEKTRAKLAPKYKEAAEKLGEFNYQKHKLTQQLSAIQANIDAVHSVLNGMEALYPVIEEFEKELTTKSEPEVD